MTRQLVKLFLTLKDLDNPQYDQYSTELLVDKGSVEYKDVLDCYQEYVKGRDIKQLWSQVGMKLFCFIVSPKAKQIKSYRKNGKCKTLLVEFKSYSKYLHQLHLETNKKLQAINARIDSLQTRVQNSNRQVYSSNIRNMAAPISDQQYKKGLLGSGIFKLDIAVLFSEPLFNSQTRQAAEMPVDFGAQIQRLRCSLANAFKPQITLQCEIATKEHLKGMISLKKPKILHIVCHGSDEGELQFEEDAISRVGVLSSIKAQQIQSLLQKLTGNLPKLVFINSCHSQKVGKIFHKFGVPFVVMIEFKQKIQDKAAQMFSQNFYRSIFRGEKVIAAFNETKSQVGKKYNSWACCCFHRSRESHKEGCLWLQLIKNRQKEKDIYQLQALDQLHNQYHIPNDQDCKCLHKLQNKHSRTCKWARKTLLAINQDFRTFDQCGRPRLKQQKDWPAYAQGTRQLMICCCFHVQNRRPQEIIPHSQHHKFQILVNNQMQDYSLYEFNRDITFKAEIRDLSRPQFTESYQKIDNITFWDRKRRSEMYNFIVKLQQPSVWLILIYGPSGIGKTSFAKKTSSYLTSRNIFEAQVYVDTYGVSEIGVLRDKLKDATGISLSSKERSRNHSKKDKQEQFRNKKMLIVIDNVDQFFKKQLKTITFQAQIQNIREKFPNAKVVVTCQDTNILSKCAKIELELLDPKQVTNLIMNKLPNLIKNNQRKSKQSLLKVVKHKDNTSLLNPKNIQMFLQYLSSDVTKFLTCKDLIQKYKPIQQGDQHFRNMIKLTLQKIKKFHENSYKMLMFISLFQQGLDQNEFKILKNYNSPQESESPLHRRQNRQIYQRINIPVTNYWKSNLAVLFQFRSAQVAPEQQVFRRQSYKELLSPATIIFKKAASQEASPDKQHQYRYSKTNIAQLKFKLSSKYSSGEENLDKQSFLMEQLKQNSWRVKRDVREFIWNKDVSEQSYYNKHIFVAYLAVLLDIYIRHLVDKKQFHQQIVECSDLSSAGIFRQKKYCYAQGSTTQSMKLFQLYNSVFEKTLNMDQNFRQTIKKKDPSEFIMRHKLDFQRIYSFDWTKVLQYLDKNKPKQLRVLVSYLQRLVILIPTALRIAQADRSLQTQSIKYSEKLLKNLAKWSKQEQYLFLKIKIHLMETAFHIQSDQNKKILEKLSHTNLSAKVLNSSPKKQQSKQKVIKKQMKKKYFATLQNHLKNQLSLLQLFCKCQLITNELQQNTLSESRQQYIVKAALVLKQALDADFQKKQNKQINKISSKNEAENKQKTQEKQFLQTLAVKRQNQQQPFQVSDCNNVIAKRYILLANLYLQILKASSENIIYSGSTQLICLIQHGKKILPQITKAGQILSSQNTVKLGLIAKLASISIKLYILKFKNKEEQNKQLQLVKQQLIKCDKMFFKPQNNLQQFTELHSQTCILKKQYENAIWGIAIQRMVFLTPDPLSAQQSPSIEHLVRNKTDLRKQITNVLDQAEVAIGYRFEKLSKTNLSQQVNRGCSLLLIRTNTVFTPQQQVFLAMNFGKKDEKMLQINQQMLRQYKFFNLKLMVIVGKNAGKAIQKIHNIMGQNCPVLISIQSLESQNIKDFSFKQLMNKNVSEFAQMIHLSSKISFSQIKLSKKLIKNIIRKSNVSIDKICNKLRQYSSTHFVKERMQINHRGSEKAIINHQQGKAKDLSTISEKHHNISWLKETSQPVFRRWADTQQIFKLLANHQIKYHQASRDQKERFAFYLQVSGCSKAGKSTFVREIGRMCMQRGLFEKGVYLLEGREISQKYDSDIKRYVQQKQYLYSQKFIQNLKNSPSRMLIIIDDYSSIKLSSLNQTKRSYIHELIQTKVNIIFTTEQNYSIFEICTRTTPLVQLQNLSSSQIKLFACAILQDKYYINGSGRKTSFLSGIKKSQMSIQQIENIYNMENFEQVNSDEPQQ